MTEVKGEETQPKVSRIRAMCGYCYRLCLHLALGLLVAGSLSSQLRLDRYEWGMLLTYVPRPAWLVFGGFLLVLFGLARMPWRVLLILLLSGLLVYESPWGSGPKDSQAEPTWTLLSFNTHYASASDIAQLCEQENVDLISLQEVQPGDVAAFRETLNDYLFFDGDRTVDFEFKKEYVFSCLTGIRRDLLSSPNVEVYTGISGYRTIGVRAELQGKMVCLVNVHTIKPVAPEFGWSRVTLEQTLVKAKRHRREHQLLAGWLREVLQNPDNRELPILLAGDFNAPANTRNLDFPGFKNAHRESGRGFHLTFPAQLPLLGIDHVLGNKLVSFSSYEIHETGLSDHCAQVVTFSLK